MQASVRLNEDLMMCFGTLSVISREPPQDNSSRDADFPSIRRMLASEQTCGGIARAWHVCDPAGALARIKMNATSASGFYTRRTLTLRSCGSTIINSTAPPSDS